jgi:hypothetical protein
LLVAVLLALGALACSVSVDLGGDESPTEAPTDTPPLSSEVVKVSLLNEKGQAHVPAGATVVLMMGWAADTPELVADYLDALDMVVTLHGERLAVRRWCRGAAGPEVVRVASLLTRRSA